MATLCCLSVKNIKKTYIISATFPGYLAVLKEFRKPVGSSLVENIKKNIDYIMNRHRAKAFFKEFCKPAGTWLVKNIKTLIASWTFTDPQDSSRKFVNQLVVGWSKISKNIDYITNRHRAKVFFKKFCKAAGGWLVDNNKKHWLRHEPSPSLRISQAVL